MDYTIQAILDDTDDEDEVLTISTYGEIPRPLK